MYRLTLIALVLLTLNPLRAMACSNGRSSSLHYIRRDNNRCEGLRNQDISIPFTLISFLVSNSFLASDSTNNYNDSLIIKVPVWGNNTPDLTIQSRYRNYLLDRITNLQKIDNYYHFNLPNTVLKKALIPPSKLRALASITNQSEITYFPVIVDQPSSEYKFTVYSPDKITVPQLEIRRNGKVIPGSQSPRPNPVNGEIDYTWNAKNQPDGRYELYIFAKQDQKSRRYSYYFEHKRNWLK